MKNIYIRQSRIKNKMAFERSLFIFGVLLSQYVLIQCTDSEPVDVKGCEKSCDLLVNYQLICEHCDCSLLPESDSANAGDMYEIHYSNNAIENITYMGSFYYLKYLDVSNNRISYIEEGAFAGLAYLEKLNLENNMIKEIREEHFKGLAGLKQLLLGENQITVLPQNVFYTNLRSVTTLSLRRNMIHDMDHNAFTDLPALQFLHLEGNFIEKLVPNYFLGLDQLEELRLDDNDIFTIPNKTFYECINLRVLNLAGNWIDTIENNAFSGLDKLETLQLSINKIKNITHGLFNGLSNIQSLYLSRNPIRYIQSESLPPTLRKLHLNDMPVLQRIRNGTFSNLKSFEEFEMTDSKKMILIEPGAFVANNSDGTSLTELTLYNNSLMTLSQDLLNWDKVDIIVLGKNDWVCDCNLVWMKSDLISDEVRKEVVCAHPHHLQGKSVYEVDESQFSCNFFSLNRYALEITLLFFTTVLFVLISVWMLYRFRQVLFPCCFIMPGKYSTLYNAVKDNDGEESVKLKFDDKLEETTKRTNVENKDREQIVPGPTSV